MALTDVKIRTTKPTPRPRKLADGGGLYLEVRPSGAKLWRYRYRIAGKENVYAIGSYPEISLAGARDLHKDARVLVKQGIHPSHQRKTDKLRRANESANTFRAISNEWIQENQKTWTYHYKNQVKRVLEQDAYPHIGALPIRQVTAAHLLEILKRIQKREAPTVALLARQWFSAIFRYAVATLRADSDPASALKGAVKRPKVKHHKPLTQKQIPRFRKKLEQYPGFPETRIALELLLLTFVRPGELRQAKWSEFDMKKAEWRIPAERMKMRELHIVPLSSQAVSLLKELHTYTGDREHLFPNHRRPKDCMTNTTLNRALEKMGYAGEFSSHGFRATASTLLNEMGFKEDVIERQLAHKEHNASRASYNQAEYLEDRRKMMQTYADYLDGLKEGAEVVPFSTGKEKSA